MNRDLLPIIAITEPSADYELLDSGDGEKLERYGKVLLRRPDPQALWRKSDAALWKEAHGCFVREGRDGRWNFTKAVPEKWTIRLANLTFNIRPTAFKHTGIFPEQAPNWDWMREAIRTAGREISVLNLFGYTGGASLVCAQAGAKVCHVDASKASVGWARDNAELSGLAAKPIRWIVDDAKAFVKRELRRGNRYDAVIMDPPAFGRGPEGDVWQIEDDFVPLMDSCRELLSDTPLFFAVNGYASGYSQLAYRYNLAALGKRFGGELESGELTIRESKGGRLLPCGIFARWFAGKK
ncbi:MAG: class I SAM-dependent methyltransferase [Verrucomicrobiota bacterium]